MGATTYSVSTAFKAIDRISSTFSTMSNAAKRFELAGKKSFRGVNKEASMLRTFIGGNLIAGAITRISSALVSLPGELVEVAKRAQALDVSFKSVFGAQATNEMNFVKRTASELGLAIESTALGYQKLAASSRGTVLQGKATKDIFIGISQAATALQLTTDQSSGAVLALSQIMSKGTLQSEELRGQLAERIPGAVQIAARALGVTTAALGDMMKAGEVSAKRFIPAFAKQLTKEFGGAAEQAAKSFQGAQNRFGNFMFQLKRNIGTIALPALSRLFIAISTFLTPLGEWIKLNKELLQIKFSAFIETVIQGFKDSLPFLKKALKFIVFLIPVVKRLAPLLLLWAAHAVLVGIAMKGLAIFQIIAGIVVFIAKVITIARWMGVWTAAQWVLNAAMTANPVGLIVVGIIALIAVVVLLVKNWDAVTKAVKNNTEALLLFLGPIGLAIQAVVSLVGHWNNIKAGFTDGGMIVGIKAIGLAIVDFMLAPLRGVFQLLSKLPFIGNVAGKALKKLSDITTLNIGKEKRLSDITTPNIGKEKRLSDITTPNIGKEKRLSDITTVPSPDGGDVTNTSTEIIAPNAAIEESKREFGGSAQINVSTDPGVTANVNKNGLKGVDLSTLGPN